MRKYAIFAVLLISAQAFAECGKDSTWTKYVKGEFFTTTTTVVNSDFSSAQSVVNEFVRQFNNDFGKLFTWTFKDIGKQKEAEKDAFYLDIKSSEFDKMTGVTTFTADILVSGTRRFKDVIISCKITQIGNNKTHSSVFVDIFYSNMLLKKAYGTIFVEKCNNREIKISVSVSVRFGWFFNIFITKKVYKDVIEWRLTKIAQNFKEEVEKNSK
ncbi:MAG: hypothetical protein LBS50_07780 [Prevotellaceae bacterium]|nr:hypothetical protein [Prevotellaceae bacterium]